MATRRIGFATINCGRNCGWMYLMTPFDASVALTEATLPPDMPPGWATELVWAAVKAIPGAGFVSVEDCRGARPACDGSPPTSRGAPCRWKAGNGKASGNGWRRPWWLRWPDREVPGAVGIPLGRSLRRWPRVDARQCQMWG